jgi:hypothetical protein
VDTTSLENIPEPEALSHHLIQLTCESKMNSDGTDAVSVFVSLSRDLNVPVLFSLSDFQSKNLLTGLGFLSDCTSQNILFLFRI